MSLKEIKESESLKYQRVLLKLSGEAFGSEKGGLDLHSIDVIAQTIQAVHQNTGVEIAIVVGAGNLFRGRYVEGTKVDRIVADQIGMLGTIMNALALQEVLERFGENVSVMSAISIEELCEPFIRQKALSYLENGRIVVLAGGTGNPYVTTDSAAAVRAAELRCNVLLKASNVDAVYDKDPRLFAEVKPLDTVTFQFALENNLNIMDKNAFVVCQSANIPVVVFNFRNPGNIESIVRGERIGTLVSS